MNKNVTLITLFFLLLTQNSPVSADTLADTFKDIKGEISIAYGNDFHANEGAEQQLTQYDGDVIKKELNLQLYDLELNFWAVSGADNFLQGKPVAISASLDYTFLKFSSEGGLNWKVKTGATWIEHEVSDNYDVGGIEGTLVNLGFEFKGTIDDIPNTYLKAGVGYTHSVTKASDSSPFAVVGLGFEIPFDKARLRVSADAVYTEALDGEYGKVEIGYHYHLNKNLTILGPSVTMIFPLRGKTTSTTKYLGVLYKF